MLQLQRAQLFLGESISSTIIATTYETVSIIIIPKDVSGIPEVALND
jgi:hypothetical protein